MDKEEMEVKNALIDVLFDQIEKLQGEERVKAGIAIQYWQTAKHSESFGLGQMTARTGYKEAYSRLKEMGLEVGGMLPPCDY